MHLTGCVSRALNGECGLRGVGAEGCTEGGAQEHRPLKAEASAAPASAAEHLNHAADEEGLLPSCLYRSLGRAWVVVLLPQP